MNHAAQQAEAFTGCRTHLLLVTIPSLPCFPRNGLRMNCGGPRRTDETPGRTEKRARLGLEHDLGELSIVDLAITIEVSLGDHTVDGLLIHRITHGGEHVNQLLAVDEARAIGIEGEESVLDLLLHLLLSLVGAGHQIDELVELDGAGLVLVDLLDEGGELSLSGVLAQGTEHGTHVSDRDGSGALLVEQVEVLAEFLLLIVGELHWCALGHVCYLIVPM